MTGTSSFITKNEYWDLIKQGQKPIKEVKHFSYANVDGERIGLLKYSSSINRFIQACALGEYYIKDESLYLPQEIKSREDFDSKKDYQAYLATFEYFEFKPFHPFDITHGKAIQFEIKLEMNYLKYCNFRIVEDPKHILYRKGDSQEVIKEFLEDLCEQHKMED
jgi:hypothetical protein